MKKSLCNFFNPQVCAVVLCFGLLTVFGASPAAAQGLDKVNTLLQSILTVLNGASIVAVTIAIVWAGYKLLFTDAGIGEALKILGAGILIGGAGQIATVILA